MYHHIQQETAAHIIFVYPFALIANKKIMTFPKREKYEEIDYGSQKRERCEILLSLPQLLD